MIMPLTRLSGPNLEYVTETIFILCFLLKDKIVSLLGLYNRIDDSGEVIRIFHSAQFAFLGFWESYLLLGSKYKKL